MKDRPIDIVILVIALIVMAGVGFLNYQVSESNKYLKAKIDSTYEESYSASAAAQQAVRDIEQIKR